MNRRAEKDSRASLWSKTSDSMRGSAPWPFLTDIAVEMAHLPLKQTLHTVESVRAKCMSEVNLVSLLARLPLIPHIAKQVFSPESMTNPRVYLARKTYEMSMILRERKFDGLVTTIMQAARAEKFGETSPMSPSIHWVPIHQVRDWLLRHLPDQPEARAAVTAYDFDALAEKIRVSWHARTEAGAKQNKDELVTLTDKKRKLEDVQAAEPAAKKARLSAQ